MTLGPRASPRHGMQSRRATGPSEASRTGRNGSTDPENGRKVTEKSVYRDPPGAVSPASHAGHCNKVGRATRLAFSFQNSRRYYIDTAN